MAVVAIINNRRIVEKAPIGTYASTWWMVELRRVATSKGPMEVWSGKHDTLADAIAEAERLGRLPEQPEAV